MVLELPKSRAQIAAIQRERKRVAVAQAKRAPFYRGKLDHVNVDRLDDPEEWRRIPILDKEMLRALSDQEFYECYCLSAPDGIAEYWRSGGATGKPLFYPRSPTDIRYGIASFVRAFDCVGCGAGERVHDSFPLGIHPVGQVFARAASRSTGRAPARRRPLRCSSSSSSGCDRRSGWECRATACTSRTSPRRPTSISPRAR
jgi:phenylacetate-CoA ligase